MSNTVTVYAVVEGKTEQLFIERILQPYLAPKNVFIYASRATKPGEKGGDIRFSRVQRDIRNYLRQRNDTYVTTMVDYYGSREWPGLDKIADSTEPSEIAEIIYQETIKELQKQYPSLNVEARFIPYMSIHEFEALLFSDLNELSATLTFSPLSLENELKSFPTPEHINNHPESAPSKRLNTLSPNGYFPKTSVGLHIAEKIGIAKMREKCPLFNNWLTVIESIQR
jgi:hypothetical protein